MATKKLHSHSHTHHIDKKLRFRLRLYFGITIILIGVLFFNVIRGELSMMYGLLGLIAGTGLGIIASRMYHTSWDHNAKKVISRLDTYGIAILILYILFELFRDTVVRYFTHDSQVATTGFAVLAGVMLGRVIGTRGKIISILKEQNVFGK